MARPRGKKKTSDNVCIHYEDIDGQNIGTCRYCGQVKKYPFPWEEGPTTLLKPGRDIMSNGDKSPTRRRRGKLTQKQKTELLTGGIEAFCKKYDYKGKAKSGIKLAHDRIQQALTALAEAPPLQPVEVQVSEDNATTALLLEALAREEANLLAAEEEVARLLKAVKQYTERACRLRTALEALKAGEGQT